MPSIRPYVPPSPPERLSRIERPSSPGRRQRGEHRPAAATRHPARPRPVAEPAPWPSRVGPRAGRAVPHAPGETLAAVLGPASRRVRGEGAPLPVPIPDRPCGGPGQAAQVRGVGAVHRTEGQPGRTGGDRGDHGLPVPGLRERAGVGRRDRPDLDHPRTGGRSARPG